MINSGSEEPNRPGREKVRQKGRDKRDLNFSRCFLLAAFTRSKTMLRFYRGRKFTVENPPAALDLCFLYQFPHTRGSFAPAVILACKG